MAILKIDLHECAEKVAEITLDEMQYKGKTLRQWADGITNPRTNADRIRAMTDEELAVFVEGSICPVGVCPLGNETDVSKTSCQKCWLDWLRQEAGG